MMPRAMLSVFMIVISIGILFIWIPYMTISPNCIVWEDNILCHADEPVRYWTWLATAGVIAVLCLLTAISMLKKRQTDDMDDLH